MSKMDEGIEIGLGSSWRSYCLGFEEFLNLGQLSNCESLFTPFESQGLRSLGSIHYITLFLKDTGSYTTDEELSDQLQNGKVIVTLFGQKLKGRYLLIRRKTKELKDSQWLLIKGNDQYASDEDLTLTRPDSVLTRRTNEYLARKEVEESDYKRLKQQKDLIEINLHTNTDELGKIMPSHYTRFPSTIKPMLGMLVDVPFDSKEWVFEVKWDGVRSILFINKVEHIVELRSRNDKSITHRYPELLSPLKSAKSAKNQQYLTER